MWQDGGANGARQGYFNEVKTKSCSTFITKSAAVSSQVKKTLPQLVSDWKFVLLLLGCLAVARLPHVGSWGSSW